MSSKTVTEVLERTAQLLQRSNQWTKNVYQASNPDGQGKTRTCRCLAGAVLVAAGLDAETNEALDATKVTRRTEASLLKTLRSNPGRYNTNVESGNTESVEEFNDADTTRHADVLRLVNDTLTRVSRR
jgi:hypothetical protein